MVTDAWVRTDAFAHCFDVGAQPFGEVGQFVHEADAGGEHGIGGVLGQFGAAVVHEHQFFVVAAKGRVELRHLVAGQRVGGADDDPVGAHAIGKRTAFLEKLGVGHHPHVQLLQAPPRQRLAGAFGHLVGRAHRHCGLDDQGAVAVHEIGDLLGDGQHMAQVCRAVFIGGGADGDENQFAMVDRVAGLGTERQASGLDVVFEQAGQPRLADGGYGLLQLLDFFGSMSMHRTRCPTSAIAAAWINPTYPVPNTLTSIFGAPRKPVDVTRMKLFRGV